MRSAGRFKCPVSAIPPAAQISSPSRRNNVAIIAFGDVSHASGNLVVSEGFGPSSRPDLELTVYKAVALPLSYETEFGGPPGSRTPTLLYSHGVLNPACLPVPSAGRFLLFMRTNTAVNEPTMITVMAKNSER